MLKGKQVCFDGGSICFLSFDIKGFYINRFKNKFLMKPIFETHFGLLLRYKLLLAILGWVFLYVETLKRTEVMLEKS